MRTFEMGEVIAERAITLRLKDGSQKDATIRLGRPIPDPSSPRDTWLCPYQITGTQRDRVFAIFGEDALQALLLAVHTIPVELAVIARNLGAEVLRHGEPDTTFLSGCRTALRFAGATFPEEAGQQSDED